MKRIYLDSAATTPLLPEVAAAMEPWLGEGFGNPSSLHLEGRRAKEALDVSREVFAGVLGCLFGEVVFTSGGTEAANLALVGAALGALESGSDRRRILVGASEHHCVLFTRGILERLGFFVEEIPVTRWGTVRVDAVGELMGDDVLLVSVMHANNELGTVNDVAAISEVVRGIGALFFVDAVQTFPGGWTVDSLRADLVSVSAHKFYGPKGVGALYVRAGTTLRPLVVGGGQEREVRGGTESVAGIVGAGVAVRSVSEWGDWRSVVAQERDAFERELEDLGLVRTVPAGVERLAGHSHWLIPGVDAGVALIRLDRAGVSASSGAACSAGSVEPSHVLLACGYSEGEAGSGLRFTFGRGADGGGAGRVVRECLAGLV